MSQNAGARTRKPKNPEQTRADILQGALEEFAARGYDAATTRGIAARIGVSHGMIRYHYRSKEKLWFAAVDFLFERLHREVALTREQAKRLQAGDLEVFRTWLRMYVRYCAKHPEHARIMMQESVSPTNRLAAAIEKHVRHDHLLVKKTIESLKQYGVFPADAPPESIIYIIAGACQNLFALAPEPKLALGYNALTPAAVDAHADAVADILCPPDREAPAE